VVPEHASCVREVSFISTTGQSARGTPSIDRVLVVPPEIVTEVVRVWTTSMLGWAGHDGREEERVIRIAPAGIVTALGFGLKKTRSMVDDVPG